MAVAVTINKSYGPKKSPLRRRIVSIAFSGTYPTGGETVTTDNFLLSASIESMNFFDGGGYVPIFDRSNSKIKMMYADYDAVADGALIEHPATALSATVQAEVIGY